jgi:hypothetical protein
MGKHYQPDLRRLAHGLQHQGKACRGERRTPSSVTKNWKLLAAETFTECKPSRSAQRLGMGRGKAAVAA